MDYIWSHLRKEGKLADVILDDNIKILTPIILDPVNFKQID